MSSIFVLSPVIRSIVHRITLTARACTGALMGLFILLVTSPMAMSQTLYPYYIYATSGFHYSAGVAANTAPGIVAFDLESLLIWCGTGGYVQTAIQEYPSSAGTVNTTSIPCTGSGGTGRISVAYYTPSGGTPTFYAIGQPLNNGYHSEFTMMSSTDGVNWTSYQANVTCNGESDTSYDQGFGLNTFQPSSGNQTLALAYSSVGCGNGGGPSVATSTDGVNFTWQAVVSSTTMYDETSSWFESPAVWQWTESQGGNNNLYVSYFNSSSQPVIAQSADGVTWSSAVSGIGMFDRDAMLLAHDDALWFGAQSYYSEENIWMAGTLDGTNFGYEDDDGGEHASAYNMGGVTTTSPVATEQAGDYVVAFRGSNGDLYVSYTNE